MWNNFRPDILLLFVSCVDLLKKLIKFYKILFLMSMTLCNLSYIIIQNVFLIHPMISYIKTKINNKVDENLEGKYKINDVI